MDLGQGGLDKPSGKRRSKEEPSGNEDGGANERGEKGAVDGLPPGTRLGKEGPMPWDVNKNSTKYLKSTISVFVPKSTKYSNVYHFVLNVGRRTKVKQCFQKKSLEVEDPSPRFASCAPGEISMLSSQFVSEQIL